MTAPKPGCVPRRSRSASVISRAARSRRLARRSTANSSSRLSSVRPFDSSNCAKRSNVSKVRASPCSRMIRRPRHPVGLLAVNQVADDVERAPRLAALVRLDPSVRKAAQHGVQRRGRAGEDGGRFVQVEGAAGRGSSRPSGDRSAPRGPLRSASRRRLDVDEHVGDPAHLGRARAGGRPRRSRATRRRSSPDRPRRGCRRAT